MTTSGELRPPRAGIRRDVNKNDTPNKDLIPTFFEDFFGFVHYTGMTCLKYFRGVSEYYTQKWDRGSPTRRKSW